MSSRSNALVARPQGTPASGSWQPLGPAGVLSVHYGLVGGRVSSLALDPADSTGNRLYVGTTGGGVWVSQSAATTNVANVLFSPLTDTTGVLSGAPDASLSIGALTVQPGGTGVILAGTGDPNDALDSYYGAGILRSADNGTTWKLIQSTADRKWSFVGEGFAGFAWSTADPQRVVAAVSQAWEGTLVDALRSNVSYEGLYYSTDAGQTWSLARITDLNGQDVQGPHDAYAGQDGNAATAVVWNPVRSVFVAAVRFHGYYQSSDGVVWTRMANQPGSRLTTALCPTNSTSTGSPACPVYRGALAVNPFTGDTFAWTVDLNNQDQGIWQDVCAEISGTCANTIGFTQQLNTAALETDISQGHGQTIINGDYNLTLAAIPSSQDTLLLAGANDLWKCSLVMGCVWRNTTNAYGCMSAQVGAYQHALEWNPANPLELFVGNDSGIWRSMDAVGQPGAPCASTDAAHFQNLNSGLGSLADVESMSAIGASPYTMMVGLGATGTAGVSSITGPTAQWPQILGGEGGPVAIDPSNPENWYVNNGAGVSIHVCNGGGACAPADFGTAPVVSSSNVNGDGDTMTYPAPFLVDPADPSQLLIATCRVWRGPASGTGWTMANVISPMFDGNRATSSCSGNALVRSIAAMALPGGGEVVYVGTYGSLNGGASLPGHILGATMDAGGTWSTWQDLTLNPVGNDQIAMNSYGLDVSSLFIDPHDQTGKTVYATIAGIPNYLQTIRIVYRSTDGGATWWNLQSNLPSSPANSVVVDPRDAGTVYVATDIGVYVTQDVSSCPNGPSNCWSVFGGGLPAAPVVALSAAPVATLPNVLTAATYGRGVWQIPLLTAGTQLTTAVVNPASLDFGTQAEGSAGAIQKVTLTNTGAIALSPVSAEIDGANAADFSISNDSCSGQQISASAPCPIVLVFAPTGLGGRAAQLTIQANVQGGQISVALSGNGVSPGDITLAPATINFDQVMTGPTLVGTVSHAVSITVNNSGGTAVHIASISTAAPFAVTSNVCGNSLAANTSCQISVTFAPTTSGPASQNLTLVDDAGTQTAVLSGTGAAPATDTLSASSLTFACTVVGQASAAQAITITNSGDVPLTSLNTAVTGPFQLSGTCTKQLAADSVCSLSVVYLPTQAGVQSGTLTLTDSVRASQTVALSGTGLLPPVFSVNPSSITFPGQEVGVASGPSNVTIANNGGAPMANIGFGITGPSASSFSFVNGTNPCGAALAAGGSCSVQVIFTPVASGGAAATLTVTSTTLGVTPSTIVLAGTGLSAAGLLVSPTQLSFPPQALYQTSPVQTVSISNTGAIAANGLALAVSGPFTLAQTTCGTSLAPQASCTASITFTPTSNGALSGALTVTSTNMTTPATVAISGTGGLTGALQIRPAQVTFPITGVGTTSSPVSISLTNVSSGVALSSFRMFASSGFTVAGNTCGASLAPSASCAVTVAFAPTTTGLQNGNLTIASASLAGNATVPLSGMGFDFQVIAAGSSTQTVASGQTANYALSLTPSSGVQAAFTFSCGSLPTYAACVFNPSSETIAANSTGTAALQLTTSQTTATLISPQLFKGWHVLPVAFGFLLVPFAWRRRKPYWAVVVLLFLAVSFSGCSSSGGGGGGSSPPPVSHSTPAGTYIIPVAITSNGVQHTISLTLIVD
ncbi:MAG TPA: choice-of-anchor D domain-containing protein [Terracidiphilus sp.]|jgi:hypothetical protein